MLDGGHAGPYIPPVRDSAEVRYRINDRNTLVFVNDAWLAEAQAAAPHLRLASSPVLGQGLWDLMTDLSLQHLFDGLFHRLRTRQIPKVTYRFRCDTPAARRLHHITITPLPDHSLEFQTSIVAVSERPSARLLDPAVPRSGDLLRICSWCKRLLVPDRGWLDMEDALRELPALDAGPLPTLTHGMCPRCEGTMLNLLADPSASGPDIATFGDWHSA